MRTYSWTLVCGLLMLVLGCQRSEKPVAHQAPTYEEAAPVAEKEAVKHAEPTEPVQAAAEPAATSVAPEPSAAEHAKTAALEEPAPKQRPTVQPEPKQPAQPSQPATTAAGQAPSKAEILASPEFRRAIFEFNEWLTSQPIYTPQQVAQIKDQFNHRVAEMNAQELTYLLNDLEAKMNLINTPEAREARAWMAQYLSVMSDRKRAEVLKEVPNVATMTAAQLSDELSRIQEKRAQLDSQQTAFQRGQAAQVAQQVQTDRTNQQNYVRDWNTGPVAYSPYSGNSNANERLNNTPIGAGMSFYTGPFGGVGVAFSPSAW